MSLLRLLGYDRPPAPPREPAPPAFGMISPAYRYRPLTAIEGLPPALADPYGPDALVFGPLDAMELQGRRDRASRSDCSRCGVTWQGIGHCWHCGRRP